MGRHVLSTAGYLCAAFLLCAGPAGADILFYDDCEDPYSIAEWQAVGTPPTHTTALSRAGNGAYSLTQAAGQNRSDLQPIKTTVPPIQSFDFNTEYWMGWSVYIPSSISFNENYLRTAQLIDYSGSGDCDDQDQLPPLDLRLTSAMGGYKLRVTNRSEPDACGDQEYQFINAGNSSVIDLDAWTDVVIHTKLNYNQPGIMQVWINGELVMDHTQPNAFNDPEGPSLMLGINTLSSDQYQAHTLYFDEIRFGDMSSSYDEVKPRGDSGLDGGAADSSRPDLGLADGPAGGPDTVWLADHGGSDRTSLLDRGRRPETSHQVDSTYQLANNSGGCGCDLAAEQQPPFTAGLLLLWLALKRGRSR